MEVNLHPSTFGYLKPTDEQVAKMEVLRRAAQVYADVIMAALPDNADKAYILRQLRATAMWVNVCVTRHSNGAPRGMDTGVER
jgi:hypothetical protein